MVVQRLGRLLPVVQTFSIARRFAGHSKWANIRHIKAEKDTERAAKFSRITKLMRAAVAENGADPSSNLKLENLMEQARSVNMPRSTMEAVLKKASTDRSQAKPVTVELVGPGGTYLLVELLTDNLRRSTNQMTAFLRKCGARLGQAKHAFNAVGVVVTAEGDLDSATEHAIEAGAEDVELLDSAADPGLVFSTTPLEVFKVKKLLQERGYDIKHAATMHVPVNSVELQGTDADLHQTLLRKLQELDDVVKVTSNASS